MIVRRYSPPLWIIACVALLMTGCNKADVDKLVDQVQEQAKSVQQEAVKVVSPGSVELFMNGEYKIPKCTAVLIVIGGGRPSVLQLRTESIAERKAGTAVFWQGTIDARGFPDVVGKTVRGELFVAQDGDRQVWQSDASLGAAVAIQSIEGNELVVQLSSTEMLSADGKTASASGTFRGVMESP